ncbi:hypothetical protein [Phnomibacter sp. MR]|uniref:hypothetical protein n=1 Tax=Phnomibacter sp. MR TaxID=3042318 RepID=UPI003A807FF1
MKKLMMMLLLAGAASQYCAYAQPFYTPNATPVSQTIFSPTAPGSQQCNFFVWLPSKNRIWFDLAWASHLSKLPDVDSLIAEAALLLNPVLDSFTADGWLRKVEMDVTQQPALFRVITHTDKPRAYTSIEKEMVLVKVDQDTLRIKFYEEKGQASYINLLVNNLADIKNLPANAGKRSVELIHTALEKNYKAPIKNNPRHAYYAVFNLETGALVSPKTDNYHAIRSGSDQLEITLLKPSLSYARGNVFTGFSFGAAFNYSKTRGAWGSRHSFGLYWEPQFSFRSDSLVKMKASRNDFLTLRFEETPNKPLANFELLSTFSIGFLIRNSGNYFEKNTFRVGLPGVGTGRLLLEPELYFNDFLKNVSPGIRLSMKIL